jgi:hypothetical protein
MLTEGGGPYLLDTVTSHKAKFSMASAKSPSQAGHGYNAAIRPTDLTSGQARFGQIEIALDPAQRFVIDHVLIA